MRGGTRRTAGPWSFSTTLASAPSNDRPARTEIVSRSSVSGTRQQDLLLALLDAPAEPDLGQHEAQRRRERRRRPCRTAELPVSEAEDEEAGRPRWPATTSLRPRKSTVRRSPGLPAMASRFSVRLTFAGWRSAGRRRTGGWPAGAACARRAAAGARAPRASAPASSRAATGAPGPGPSVAHRRWRRRRAARRAPATAAIDERNEHLLRPRCRRCAG